MSHFFFSMFLFRNWYQCVWEYFLALFVFLLPLNQSILFTLLFSSSSSTSSSSPSSSSSSSSFQSSRVSVTFKDLFFLVFSSSSLRSFHLGISPTNVFFILLLLLLLLSLLLLGLLPGILAPPPLPLSPPTPLKLINYAMCLIFFLLFSLSSSSSFIFHFVSVMFSFRCFVLFH